MGFPAVNLEAQEMDDKDYVAIAVLGANARNIEANLSRLEGKVDAGFLELKSEMKSGFQRSDVRIDQLDTKVDAGFSETRKEIQRLDTKIDGVKDSIVSAKIWALALYIALAAGLLGAMTQGFLWLAEKISVPTSRTAVLATSDAAAAFDTPPTPALSTPKTTRP